MRQMGTVRITLGRPGLIFLVNRFRKQHPSAAKGEILAMAMLTYPSLARHNERIRSNLREIYR